LTPLALAIVLAVAAGFGVWLYVGPARPESAAASLLGTADYLEERVEERLESGTPRDRAEAMALMRQALLRDPASPYRWSTMGELLAESGDNDRARYCFRRAVELGPNIPPVLMRAANFHFTHGAAREGLECTRKILGLVRQYDGVVFSTCERMGVRVAEVIAHGMPADKAAHTALLQHLLTGEAAADAAVAWRWLEGLGECDTALTSQYVEFLLKHAAYSEAREVWARRLGRQNPGYPGSNRVFNGGFESEPLKEGLDWRVTPAEGVSADRGTGGRSGRWSLHIRFEGQSNLDYRHISQRVVAEPGAYRFSAWVRADEVTTDEGVRFRIRDAGRDPRVDVTTAQVVGTTDWTELAAVVVVPAPVRLLAVELIRRPSLKFDNKISGTVRVDDVRLARISHQQPAAARDSRP
jgi:hypothetical protein